MKNIRSLAALAILALVSSLPLAHAAESHTGELGVGIILGEPTGLSAKYWKTKNQAFDAALAYSFDDFFMVYADYLLHFPSLLSGSKGVARELMPFLGIGGVISVGLSGNGNDGNLSNDDDFAVGIRIPLGIEWLPSGTPLGISLEIAPGLSVIPSTDGFLQGGLALRYYFN